MKLIIIKNTPQNHELEKFATKSDVAIRWKYIWQLNMHDELMKKKKKYFLILIESSAINK